MPERFARNLLEDAGGDLAAAAAAMAELREPYLHVHGLLLVDVCQSDSTAPYASRPRDGARRALPRPGRKSGLRCARGAAGAQVSRLLQRLYERAAIRMRRRRRNTRVVRAQHADVARDAARDDRVPAVTASTITFAPPSRRRVDEQVRGRSPRARAPCGKAPE
jgi:hypothetical protein